MSIWRTIEEYPLYEASINGKIRNSKTGKVLADSYDKDGYLRISTTVNGKRKQLKVHRLIAKSFPEICGDMFEGCVVDHINRNRSDNRAENLKVCTVKENANNPLTQQARVPWNKGKTFLGGTDNPRATKVVKCDKDGNIIARYDMVSDCAKDNGVAISTMSCYLTGYRKASDGFVYKYEEVV